MVHGRTATFRSMFIVGTFRKFACRYLLAWIGAQRSIETVEKRHDNEKSVCISKFNQVFGDVATLLYANRAKMGRDLFARHLSFELSSVASCLAGCMHITHKLIDSTHHTFAGEQTIDQMLCKLIIPRLSVFADTFCTYVTRSSECCTHSPECGHSNDCVVNMNLILPSIRR